MSALNRNAARRYLGELARPDGKPIPARTFAIGGFVGLGAGLASASTACDPTARDARCTTASAREVTSSWRKMYDQ